MRLLVSLALLAVIGLAGAQPDASIVPKLRQGGYVLYFRHTSTDFSQNDARMTSYADCSTQRNLTDKGRDEARAIRSHFQRLKIPVGAIYASPFCRTIETARLAVGEPQATNEARGGPSRPDDPARYEALKKLLATPPAAGRNNVIASHGNPFYAVFGQPYLAEGEMAVVDPKTVAIVARVRLEDWAGLKP